MTIKLWEGPTYLMRRRPQQLRNQPARSSEASPTFRHTQELLLLEQVMRLVGKGLLLDRILHEMLHLMSEMLGLNRGRIALVDKETGGPRIRYADALTKKEAERGRYALGEGIIGRAPGSTIVVTSWSPAAERSPACASYPIPWP